LTRTSDASPPETVEQRLAIAAALLIEHREATTRHERAGHHVIVAAWNAGMSQRRIAAHLQLSRDPIAEELRLADAAGELRRPLNSRTAADGVPVEAGASYVGTE